MVYSSWTLEVQLMTDYDGQATNDRNLATVTSYYSVL